MNIAAAQRHILRRDLLAQLRASQTPLTTAELRAEAPAVPVAGAITPLLPTHEQVYRSLCSLQRAGLVIRHRAYASRNVQWSAAPSPADDEIAELETLFASPTYEATDRRSR